MNYGEEINYAKLFDIKGQNLLVEASPEYMEEKILHYCNEKGTGGKASCLSRDAGCIEVDIKNRFNFSK